VVKNIKNYLWKEYYGKNNLSSGKAESRSHIYNGIIEARGNTPLVKLSKLGREILGKDLPGTILAKIESFNPMNSVKCRTEAAN